MTNVNPKDIIKITIDSIIFIPHSLQAQQALV